MNTSRSQTRATYDRLSRWYDLLAGSSERACRVLGLRKLDVQQGECVLEIGSGTGDALRWLSQAVGPAGCAWGIDLSSGMCRVAASRPASGPAAESQFRVFCGDATALPFRAAAFDAVFMSFTLELFQPADMSAVLAECARALRVGGRLGVVALAESASPGRMERLYVQAHRRFPAWVDCRPIRVAEVLVIHGFNLQDVTHASMWGLQVDVVIGRSEKTTGLAQ